jgi:lipid II:glycine glycyltransferase (peptidoglycan interpeptide bridge formation enzyme)
MLFIRHGNSATYHMGHNGPDGRVNNAHNLILWDAMRRLKALGVTRLDLGTIDAKNAPDLARFKQRTGAQARSLGPAQLV